MKKKILAVLAVIALVVAMLPTMAFADEQPLTSFEFTATPLTRDNIKTLIAADDFGITSGGSVFYLSFFKEDKLQYYYGLGHWFDANGEMPSAPENFYDVDKAMEIIYFRNEAGFDTENCTVTANGTALDYEEVKPEVMKSYLKQYFTYGTTNKVMIASLVYDLGPLTSFDFTATPLTRDNLKSLIDSDDFGISPEGYPYCLSFFDEDGKVKYYYSLEYWFDANKQVMSSAPENFNDILKVTELILFLSDIEFDTSNCTVTANGTALPYEEMDDPKELEEQTKQCFTFGDSKKVLAASLVYDLGPVTSLNFNYTKLTRDNLMSIIKADDYEISSGGKGYGLGFFKEGKLKYQYALGIWFDADRKEMASAPENFNDVDQVMEIVIFRSGAGFDTENFTVTANGTPLEYEEGIDILMKGERIKQCYNIGPSKRVLIAGLLHNLDSENPKTADANSALPYACAACAAIVLIGFGIRKIRRER